MNKLVRAVSLAGMLAAVPVVASAQNQFNIGTKVAHVGLLVGDEVGGGVGIGGGFEVGVAEIAGQVRLGVGGSLGILRNSYGSAGFGFTSDVTNTVMPILGFVHGHYQIEQVPQLDVYAGPAVGLTRYSIKSSASSGGFSGSSSTSNTNAAIGIQAGARYAFTPALAAQLQLSAGSNLPFLNTGIAFKF